MITPFQRARDATTLADIIRGTPGPDTLAGTADGQTIAGLRGADRLSSAFTGVTLAGGVGADRLLSTYSLGAGAPDYAAFLDGGVGNDRLTVRLDAAGSYSEAFSGSATLLASGGDGDDRINVTAIFDNQTIFPAFTFDFLILGGAGDDTIRFDYREVLGARDGQIRISGGAGADVVDAFVASDSEGRASVVFDGDGGGGGDVFRVSTEAVANKSGVSNFAAIVGQGGDDVIELTHLNRGAGLGEVTSRLSGGSGDDIVTAVAVTDDVSFLVLDQRLLGGGGDDELRAEVPFDGNYQEFDGMNATNRLEGGGGNDLLVGIFGAVEVYGADFRATHAFGGEGDDRIVLTGGNANKVSGGAGTDTIVLQPLSEVAQRTHLLDFDRNADRFEIVGLADRGAPGLVDDLDAIAAFSTAGPGGLRIVIGALTLDVSGAPAGADSFADLVANPTAQIFASDDALV